MLARLSAFVVWALVAGALVFWGLRLMVSAPAAPAYAVAVGDVAVAKGDLTALLGAAPVVAAAVNAPPPAASRFHLFGIVAPKVPADLPTRGVALIAIDNKMPKAYAIGSRIDGEMMLKSVSLRTVSIGSDGSDAGGFTLELPPLAPAATGTLPLGGAADYAAPPGGAAMTPHITPQTVPQRVPQAGPSARPPMQPQYIPPPSGFARPAS